MKKAFAFVAMIAAVLVGASIAAADNNGVGATGVGVAMPGIVSVTAPVPAPASLPDDHSGAGFLQLNNLSVVSVSAQNAPAEIIATGPGYLPMMGANGASAGTGTGMGMMGSASNPSVVANPPVASAPLTSANATCLRFTNENDATGVQAPCPMPPARESSTAAYPYRGQTYRIEVDASTKLLLRDRTSAILSNMNAGDQINVFGYYNADGSVQAYLVRNLSKPVESQYLQLNNVDLVSVSASTSPATLVVIQQPNYPCYGFGSDGSVKQGLIACPMGVQTSAMGAMMPNLSPSIASIWQMSRKYTITIDAQTVILDRNRTRLALTDLTPGDELNIYGATNDNGQTVNADIVRNLSIPTSPATYSGTVTQVNADGSFVIKTSDGRSITVANPIAIGASVQVTGLLDRLQNIISQVTSIFLGTKPTVIPPTPTNAPVQGLRVNAGVPLPAGSGGTPNTAN